MVTLNLNSAVWAKDDSKINSKDSFKISENTNRDINTQTNDDRNTQTSDTQTNPPVIMEIPKPIMDLIIVTLNVERL